MFGIFGAGKNFETEISKLKNEGKLLATQLIFHMQRFELTKQAEVANKIIAVNQKQIECYRRNGKFEEAVKLEEANQKLIQLNS